MKNLKLTTVLIIAQYILIVSVASSQSKKDLILGLKDSVNAHKTRLNIIENDIKSIQDSFRLISTKMDVEIEALNMTIKEHETSLQNIQTKKEIISQQNTPEYNILVNDNFDTYAQRCDYVSTSYLDSISLEIIAQSYIRFNEFYYIEEINTENKQPTVGSINGYKFSIKNGKIEGDLFSFPAGRASWRFIWVYHNSSLNKENTEYLFILEDSPFPKIEDINDNYHLDIGILAADHVYGKGEIMAILAVDNHRVKLFFV